MINIIRASAVFYLAVCAASASFAGTNMQGEPITNLSGQTNLSGEIAVIVALNEPLNADSALLTSPTVLSTEQIDEIQSKFINSIKAYALTSYKLSEAPSVVLKINAKALDTIERMSAVGSIVVISDDFYEQLVFAD